VGVAQQYAVREPGSAAVEVPTRQQRSGVKAFSIEDQLIRMDLYRKGEQP
jgi:hypothetical protein